MPRGSNLFEQKLNKNEERTNEAQKVQDHLDYGIITDVDFDSYKVQVQLFGLDNVNTLGLGYWPLISQREDIFLRWGQLRTGLTCRVHWRGQYGRATWAAVEIIGDEDSSFIKQLDMPNDPDTLPHKLLAGGLKP